MTFGGVQEFTRKPSTAFTDDDGNFAGIVHLERGVTYALFQGAGHTYVPAVGGRQAGKRHTPSARPARARATSDIIVWEPHGRDTKMETQEPGVFKQLPESTNDMDPSYLGRGIADVLDFYKGDKKAQLIIASSTPMETFDK
ncbi:hypothetical protein GGX14DRAFT_607325 [Mycena pura]|uniref:Uncharacterized protein n=1 Tax=Mycena pura TaxID=153505 RepID=A0AAD6VPE5_9AGAR|nr:hypothetical protein GGX14DRAFT_607325 [Mycena pura]